MPIKTLAQQVLISLTLDSNSVFLVTLANTVAHLDFQAQLANVVLDTTAQEAAQRINQP